MKLSISVALSIIFYHCQISRSFNLNPSHSRIFRNQVSTYVVPPEAMYGEVGEDNVWNNMRIDAQSEASKEPLLASFMHATILSHSSLERALAFHIANLLSSPAMISTQIQALILEVSLVWLLFHNINHVRQLIDHLTFSTVYRSVP